MGTHTLRKSERLCSRKAVEALFSGGAKGFTVWPLRAVFKEEGEQTQVLIVAPKRRLHHAVDRNRAKRQVREAYRLQKHLLSTTVRLAFVWIADCPVPSQRVHEAMHRILCRVTEKTAKPCDNC